MAITSFSMSDPNPESSKMNGTDPDDPIQPNFQLKLSLAGHQKGVSSVKFSPSGTWLATAGADGVVQLWETATWDHVRALRGHENGINDMAFSPNGLYLATASDDLTAKIWLVPEGKLLRTLSKHTSYVTCLAFNPKSNILATGSWDERVILWDIKSGGILRELPAHSDPLTAVGYNADGTMVITSSFDGLMRLWDASTGQCLKTIEDENNAPVSFANFTPNGDYIISSTLSSTIRIWNFHTTKCLKTFQGHVNLKYCCPASIVDPSSLGLTAASDLGAKCRRPWLIAGSEAADDSTGLTPKGDVIIWDLQSREILQTLEGHKDSVISVAIHPTRPIIASGSLERDKLVRIWMDDTMTSQTSL